jgi:signal transduction histidine kinase
MEKGLGLVGIEERVTHLGGTLRIDSHAGRGTLLAITLPLASVTYDHDQNPVG